MELSSFWFQPKTTYGSHNGQACFIINATVRNDYTAKQPPPIDSFGDNSVGVVYFGLTAKLYDYTGLIAPYDVTCSGLPPLWVPQIGLESGQTFEVEIDMATSSRNVNNYTISVVDLAGYPYHKRTVHVLRALSLSQLIFSVGSWNSFLIDLILAF